MNILDEYKYTLTDEQIAAAVAKAKADAEKMQTADNLKLALSLVDLTTLNTTDTLAKGEKFATNVNNFSATYPGIPDVAAICVYPSLVKAVASTLNRPGVGVASVAAGFPTSQTFIEVKTLECQKAVSDGATDIDIVISVGKWLAGDFETVGNEIRAIKNAIGNAHLKVILETGALRNAQDIWNASIVAMAAGADFIKTSTGKMEPAATPEAVYVMCEAIKAFAAKGNRNVGIKPAGGMSVSADAMLYMAVVKNTLGNAWLNNKMFRLGASRMANNLLKDILSIESGKLVDVKYF
ncbi:MAG: deoxyribose-phosphate aldolase [Salinivirgaceae bacterium]|nr:deoxyribose-phosphate aldolase [Salinivirgaceae bacterium]